MKKTPSGFTLIELMITVVIVGILAAIAYPSYQTYVKQTRRSDAQIALTQAANQQERYFTECNTYTSNLGGTRTNTCNGELGYGTSSPESYYTLAAAAGTINSGCAAYSCGYTLTATPVTTGLQANDGKFRIDSTGLKQWDKADDNSYSAKWTDK